MQFKIDLPHVTIYFIFYILLTEKCLSTDWWKAFIDNSIFKSLKFLNAKDNVEETLSFYLHKRSVRFKEIIKVNYVNKSEVKSIIGSIICCPFFENVTIIHRLWRFLGDTKLRFNITFTYFNVGRVRKFPRLDKGGDMEEYVKHVTLYTELSNEKILEKYFWYHLHWKKKQDGIFYNT